MGLEWSHIDATPDRLLITQRAMLANQQIDGLRHRDPCVPRLAADRLWTASEVAERTRVGLPTVSKLLKKLQRSGLVVSTRGSHGGYQLARPRARSPRRTSWTPWRGRSPSRNAVASTAPAGSNRIAASDTPGSGSMPRSVARSSDISLAQLAGMERGVMATIPLTRLGARDARLNDKRYSHGQPTASRSHTRSSRRPEIPSRIRHRHRSPTPFRPVSTRTSFA